MTTKVRSALEATARLFGGTASIATEAKEALTELATLEDATWNAALEAAAKVLLDSGLQGNTASKHEVASRILSLRRPTP